MSKYIDAEEITPIMAEYVADVFSRKEHLDNISYGYCMEIADVFRRYAKRAEQEQSESGCSEKPNDLLSEWTEEDERIRWNLCSLLTNLRVGKKIEESTFEKYYPWLKIIHIKPRKPRKSKQPEMDLEKASRNVYESWMGGTMDNVRRDMVELGKVLNARKED